MQSVSVQRLSDSLASFLRSYKDLLKFGSPRSRPVTVFVLLPLHFHEQEMSDSFSLRLHMDTSSSQLFKYSQFASTHITADQAVC